MADAVDTLKSEHRIIEKVLDALELAAAREAPPGFYARAIDFLSAFADKCHHGKEEDRLFPCLERCGIPREGGPILDMGAHVFDALRWYSGSEVATLFARIHDFSPGLPPGRTSMIQATLASGVIFQSWMSFEMPTPGLGSQAQWTLVGSDGIIEADHYGKVRLGRGDSWELVFEMPPFGLASDTISPVRLRAFAAQVQDFADAIRDGRKPAVSGVDGRAAIELVDAARLSSASGRAVELPLAA